MHVVTLDSLRLFDPAKMRKNNLFETPRFFCDLYCLEPGQSQAAHAHDHEDKVMIVLEGEARIRCGEEERTLTEGKAVVATAGVTHGVSNASGGRAVVLVFMAPHPKAGTMRSAS